MKIILSNPQRVINRKTPWFYFGSSYLKMKNCENRFPGKRISLQNEIHLQAEIQKNKFLKWVELQRETNEDSIYWWMTQIAGRNNAYSNFYLNLCQFFAIKEYLEKNSKSEEIIIVCEDIFLMKLIRQNLNSKLILQTPPLFKFYWFKDILSLILMGLFNQMRLACIFAIHFFYAKVTKPKKILKPKGSVSLFHHCLDKTDAFQNGNITCKYFTVLPNWLKKKGIQVFALPWFTNIPTKNFYKHLRKTDVLIPEDWLNIKDYFNVFRNSFKSSKTLSYKIPYSTIEIKHLIFRERLSQLGESGAIFWRYIPAIKKWSTEIKSLTVYDHYENMIFEHPIRYIIKKLPIKSKSIGYYHSLVTKEFMPYHHLSSEWNSSIKPDYVACLGKISENLLLKQGVPKNKLLSTAALRQTKVENGLLKSKNSNQVLILLSLNLEASIETLLKIYSNNSLIIDDLKLRIKVKCHPKMKAEKILKQINWKKLPKGWEWAERDLDVELDNAYCCIAMFTASVYDAVLKGNIILSLTSDLNLMDNYLDLFVDKYSLARTVSEKELVEKLKDIFISSRQKYQDEFSLIRKELIEGINPINSENLSKFLI